ncbi:hypothetical protein J4864_01140 [Prevotella multiformis]|uniref:hypothetical protein n=1 Tax=Prevotella multiformis TaxID=282402 RepID=UPI001BA9C07C|nr:hypothetical protein [Prevotella multiformis]QUB70860.1 hypothetical protein J4864_01140 [Prevotella multiformis]
MPKKKKAGKGQQQFLSPEKYLRTKARMLQKGQCYRSSSLFEAGEGYVIVTRKHMGGKISFAAYLIDTYCVGVKGSFYRLRVEEDEFEDFLDRASEGDGLIECSYEEAHNIVYGAVEFAGEADIEPDKSFALSRYMLEEDTEDVPLIEYRFGKDGRHFLVASSGFEASRYLPKLKKTYGTDFKYITPCTNFGVGDSDYKKSPTYGLETKYTYTPPRYAEAWNVHNRWLVEELSKPENSMWLEDRLIDRILALPEEELRADLEAIIRYVMTITSEGKIPEGFDDGRYNGILASAIILLGEVGNNESSLDLMLECCRQSEGFYDYHFGDCANEIIVPTLYKLVTPDKFAKLLEFMKEPGLYSMFKCCVSCTMALLARRRPEQRQACLEWFGSLVTFATETLPKVQYIDGSLAGFITADVVSLHTEALLPGLKAMYATGCVDQKICGGIDEVEYLILHKKDKDEFMSSRFEIHERFADMKARSGNTLCF